ncbi:MAG: hypothetical protein ACM30I_00885 [Gemmatimonas sp.]
MTENANRLMAEADKCAGDAARIRGFIRMIPKAAVAGELMMVAARLESSSEELRQIAGRIQ